MKIKNVIMTALVTGMLLTGTVGSVYSYFTTNAEATGSASISLGSRTEVEEDFSAWTKRVAITSKKDSKPVYVRVKAFCGSEYSLTYSDEEGNWTPGSDGYYYYTKVLEADATTDALFDQIVLGTDTVNGDATTEYKIPVKAEAVQAQGAKTKWADVQNMKVEEIAAWFATCMA